jgi:hypothetical protein
MANVSFSRSLTPLLFLQGCIIPIQFFLISIRIRLILPNGKIIFLLSLVQLILYYLSIFLTLLQDFRVRLEYAKLVQTRKNEHNSSNFYFILYIQIIIVLIIGLFLVRIILYFIKALVGHFA